MSNSKAVLRLPQAVRVQYERDYITTAVCELRFPTLLEYEEKKPIPLASLLRKEYPHYQPERGVNIAPGVVEKDLVKHVFLSKKRDWVVSFNSSALSLETKDYTKFEDFSGRLKRLIEQTREFLDTDFYTRVGLRYINEIPMEKDDSTGGWEGWIHPDLVKPWVDGTYGAVDRFFQEIGGRTHAGRYMFRHGVGGATATGGPIYILDFDFYEQDVAVDDTLGLVTEFNAVNFQFFSWATGPKAINRLGKATPKET
jgi:uncharacterized protein (TIGR04255 family)